MKVKSNGSKLPNAWVVSPSDKGRRKIYNDNKIYLKNGEEFEIELYNPTQKNVLALISLDGKPISKSGLVVKSGERFYLDCFLDDLKKFTFETYDVEDNCEVNNAISKNGELEIYFYNEEIADRLDLSKFTDTHHHHHHHHDGYRCYPIYYNPIWYGTANQYTIDCNNTGNNVVNNTLSTTYNSDSVGTTLSGSIINDSSNIETGQTSKGYDSNQLFKDVEMEFEENHISNVSYKLLPESRIPKTSKDVSNVSMEKISNKLADSEFITDLMSRLVSFSELKDKKLIEKEEFNLIQEKTINSIIDMSSEIVIEYIDDLGSYIFELGSLMENKLITKDDFNTIKANLFNSIK